MVACQQYNKYYSVDLEMLAECSSAQQLFSSIPAAGDAYWKNNTMFDLEYCNWNKDIFMGVLPDSQFGDVASIDTGGLKSQDLYVEAQLSSSQVSLPPFRISLDYCQDSYHTAVIFLSKLE